MNSVNLNYLVFYSDQTSQRELKVIGLEEAELIATQKLIELRQSQISSGSDAETERKFEELNQPRKRSTPGNASPTDTQVGCNPASVPAYSLDSSAESNTTAQVLGNIDVIDSTGTSVTQPNQALSMLTEPTTYQQLAISQQKNPRGYLQDMYIGPDPNGDGVALFYILNGESEYVGTFIAR